MPLPEQREQTEGIVALNVCDTQSQDWSNWKFTVNLYHLYLLQLVLVGGVHLLQGLLQFMVPLKEAFPELRCQMEI